MDDLKCPECGNSNEKFFYQIEGGVLSTCTKWSELSFYWCEACQTKSKRYDENEKLEPISTGNDY